MLTALVDPLAGVNSNGTYESLVNTETRRAQAFSDVASFDGGSVIVWSSYLQDGSGWGIFGQRYDGMGEKLGGEFRVNTTTHSAQHAASVAAFDNGDFVVAWMTLKNTGWDIHTQVFQRDGSPVGGEVLVSGTTAGNQVHPFVETLTNDNYVVAWQGRGRVGGVETQGIFARIFNQSGESVSHQIPISNVNFGGQEQFDLAATPNGGFAVAYQGSGNGDNIGIYLRSYDAQGRAEEVKHLVNQSHRAGLQWQPSLATDAEGNMFVSWTSPGDGSSMGVYVQQFDADFNRQGSTERVAQEHLGAQWRSEIALLQNGNFVVTWQGRGESDRDGVFIREFNSESQALGDEIRVSQTVDGLQRFAVVDAAATGVTVAWHGRGQEDRFGVYTRFFQTQNLAPVATDFNLGVVSRGTKLNVDAADIISEFGTDVDSVLNSMSVNFTDVVAGGAGSSLMDVGFNYMAGAGTGGGFMIDTLASAFENLSAEQTIDVVIDFTVSDGFLEDMGQFTFTVIGDEASYEQANFLFLGETVLDQELNVSANMPNQSTLSASLTGYSDVSEALLSVDFTATPRVAMDSLMSNEMLTLAAVFSDSSSQAESNASNNSRAYAEATGNSESAAFAGLGSVSDVTADDSSIANGVANDDSVAIATSSTGSDSLALALGNSTAEATSESDSSSSATAEDASTATSLAVNQSTATAQATHGSDSEAAANDVSVANAETDLYSGAIAVAHVNSAASAVAKGVSNGNGSNNAQVDSGSNANALAENGSSAETLAENASSSTATAHDESVATATSKQYSQSLATADQRSSATAFSDIGGVSGADATFQSIANAVSLDTSIASANADFNSDSMAVAKSGSAADADSQQQSSSNAGAVDASRATATAEIDSTAIAMAEIDSVANADASSDSVAMAAASDDSTVSTVSSDGSAARTGGSDTGNATATASGIAAADADAIVSSTATATSNDRALSLASASYESSASSTAEEVAASQAIASASTDIAFSDLPSVLDDSVAQTLIAEITGETATAKAALADFAMDAITSGNLDFSDLIDDYLPIAPTPPPTTGNGSEALAAAVVNSIADARAVQKTLATASAQTDSTSRANAFNLGSATASAGFNSTSAAIATDNGIATAVALNNSDAVATASDGSDSIAFADVMSISSSTAAHGSTTNATTNMSSNATATADNQSTAFANANNDSSASAFANDEAVVAASAQAGESSEVESPDAAVSVITIVAALPTASVPNIKLSMPNTNLTGTPGSAIDIPIVVTELDGQTIDSIVISDLPVGTILSAGMSNADGTEWTFTTPPPADLTLTTPVAFSGEFEAKILVTRSSTIVEATQTIVVSS